MNKIKYSISALALLFISLIAFTACGGGDDGDGYDGGGSYTDYKALLLGLWSGKGTNWNGDNFEVSVDFKTSTTGWVLMSWVKKDYTVGSGSLAGSMGHVLSDFSSWSASESYISMSADNFASPVTMRVTSGSIASGKMTVEIRCENDNYNGTIQLTREGGASSGGSSSSGDTEMGVTTAKVITYYTSSGNFYSHSKSCWVKKTAGGSIYLYSDPDYTSRIGLASYNSESKLGGYSVSRYTYVVTQSGSGTITYYFFD